MEPAKIPDSFGIGCVNIFLRIPSQIISTSFQFAQFFPSLPPIVAKWKIENENES
jgi:hypothetical protein